MWSGNIYLTDVSMMVWGVMVKMYWINHTGTPKWKSSLQTLVSAVKHPIQSEQTGGGMEGRCYERFFSFTEYFHRLPFPFALATSLLSSQTPISTDWFSCADYVVLLTYRFSYILSHSTMTHRLD